MPIGSKINKENGYIELTRDTEGYTYTVTVSNDVNSMVYSFDVVQGNAAQEPVRFLRLGYYEEYEFAVGYPVSLPLYVTGPITLCQMIGDDIPGLTFNLNGLHGTPTTANLTIQTLKFYCRNEVTTTNEFVLKTMVHPSGKPGLIGNYWKWVRYTLAFPCNAKINPQITPGATLEVQKVANSITINSDNDFLFYPDFKSYYGVMYTGYIAIAEDKSYVFSTQSATGSYIEIDNEIVVNHATNCHPSSKVSGDPVYLTAGYHRITLSMSRKDIPAQAKFMWKKDGVSEIEISMNDLSHVPMNSITYEMPINVYQKTDAGVPVNNFLLSYDVTIRSCSLLPEKLPNGMLFNFATGALSGIPTEITTFADNVYTVTCQTDRGAISHQFTVEVRDFDFLPAIPYIMLKRAADRRVPVKPDMYFQKSWVIDHSCYPNGIDLYWKITKAPDSIAPVSCSGTARKISCIMRVSGSSGLTGTFDPETDYDQAFQLVGTASNYYQKSTYLLVASINNDQKRSAALKFSFTHTEVTPIPGWVYFGVWTVTYGGTGVAYMPDAPEDADSRCCKYELYDRNGIELLSLPGGFPLWLLRQGLLLEPNEYKLHLFSPESRFPKCKKGAFFNVTTDNTHTLYHVNNKEKIEISYKIQRMECVGITIGSDYLPTTTVGGIIEFECPSKQFGKRTRQCTKDTSGSPYWASEKSTCRAYIPITLFSYEVQYINVPINTKFTLTPTVVGDYDIFEFGAEPPGVFSSDTETGTIVLYSETTLNEIKE